MLPFFLSFSTGNTGPSLMKVKEKITSHNSFQWRNIVVAPEQIWKTTKQHFNSPDTFPNVQLQIHIDFLSLTSVLSRVILNNKHTELIFISYLYLPWPSCSICYLYFNGSTFSSYSFHIVILFQHCSHVCFVLSLFCCCFTIVKYSLCIRWNQCSCHCVSYLINKLGLEKKPSL